MNSTDVEIDENELDELSNRPKKELKILGQLLDMYLNAGRVVGLTSQMGETTAYESSQRLDWMADNLSLFTMLPIMENHRNGEGGIVIDKDTVEISLQRTPDFSRQAMLSKYLVTNPKRRFPPILVVVSETWVDNSSAPEWVNGRATRASVSVTPIDSRGRMVFIDLSNATIFTVDGQHRLLGIQGVRELARTGQIEIKKKDGTSAKKALSLRDFTDGTGLSHSHLAEVLRESMGIEFIPAVMPGETYDEARQRIRSIFVHVNQSAKPVTQGELATLSEDDGFSIVARRVGTDHPLFSRDTAGDRINWKGTALPAGGKWLTSVATLRDIAAAFLAPRVPYSSWLPEHKGKSIPIRPDAAELSDGENEMVEFWDEAAKLPSFGSILRGGQIDEWREFPTAEATDRRGHLLFRPLGQLILASAVGELLAEGLLIGDIFKKVKKYDKQNGFENVHLQSSPWYGITYDPFRKKMLMTGRNTAISLLKYLINGATGEELDDLIAEFRNARVVPGKDGREVYLDHDGKPVARPEDVNLPPMI